MPVLSDVDPISALLLIVYKPLPFIESQYMISNIAILEAFSSQQKSTSDKKVTPTHWMRQPSKIYHSPYLTEFRSSSKGREKVILHMRKTCPFKGYNITGTCSTGITSSFREWIQEGLYK